MKKLLFFIALLSVSVLFHSCENEKSFDETLLWGKWRTVTGNLYYRYLPNHTGATWDEDDDVHEDEAQGFEWKLVKSELRQIHIMEMGGAVPKTYTVTELTATSLKYRDKFNKSFSFVKAD